MVMITFLEPDFADMLSTNVVI